MSNTHNNGRWSKITVRVENPDQPPLHILVSGRVRWALESLMAAGERGCTPIDTPGPRWSDYVFKLRGEGVQIETVTETHEGPFAGQHARYVLRSRIVSVMSEVAA